mmetsp:Transcript_29645/g.76627  ORF Transcript_29645/g.76627 Transcript_29645/m.76627 type:complete len:127 (+) Transcript_29645:79-459(+)
MVKEGHDSTVRPKVQTYEFDNGRMYLDVWAADGKATLSKTFMGRMRVLKVLACAAIPAVLVFSDWGEGTHVFTPIRQSLTAWWRTFVQLDVADVAKGQSVGTPLPPHSASSSSSSDVSTGQGRSPS